MLNHIAELKPQMVISFMDRITSTALLLNQGIRRRFELIPTIKQGFIRNKNYTVIKSDRNLTFEISLAEQFLGRVCKFVFEI